MPASIANNERSVAAIFNSAIAATAIAAAWEVGLLGELQDKKSVDVHAFAIDHDLDLGSLQGLCTSLAIADVVEHDRNTLVGGRLLEEANRTASLFHWLTIGSGGLFSRMQYVLRNENRRGSFFCRDAVAIAHACRDINRQHFDPIFWKAMDGLDYDFHSVVDLGSGSGERLMQVLEKYPDATGIGIDIAGDAIQVSIGEAAERGLSNRLSFKEADVCELNYHEDFDQVDLLTCFLMGHDFWPRANCVAVLQRLRKAFPRVSRLLLGDTVRILLDSKNSKHAATEDNVPIFTLGFEFGHALMGAFLPTMEDWEDVFSEGGWHCKKRHLVPSPSLSVIFELEHA